MLVVPAGAKNSSNSTRLRETGAASKIPAFLVAGRNELDLEALREAKIIGLTAAPRRRRFLSRMR